MRPTLAIALSLILAAPALAQDKPSWNFREDEEGLSLGYAIPDSDDAGPFFYCQRGEGKIGVVFFVETRLAVGEPTSDGQWLNAAGQPQPWKGEMTVISGPAFFKGHGEVTNDEMNGGSMIELKIAADAEVFAQFARTGRIELTAFDESSDLPAAPVARVRSLIGGCRKG